MSSGLFSLFACRPPATQVLVYVDTDVPRADLDHLEARAGDQAPMLPIAAEEVPASFGLAPGASDLDTPVELRVTAVLKTSARIERIQSVHFVAHQRLHLPLCLRSRCRSGLAADAACAWESKLREAPLDEGQGACAADLEEGGGGNAREEPDGGMVVQQHPADSGSRDSTVVHVEPQQGPAVMVPEEGEEGDLADAGHREDAADAGALDAGGMPRPEQCPAVVLPGTVGLWTFQQSLVVDALGLHAAVGSGSPSRTPGPAGCGDAVRFPRANGPRPTPYLFIPNDPAWDLPVGSVDLWVKTTSWPQPGENGRGIVSRDATDQVYPGHFGIYLGCDGRIVARIQRHAEGMEMNTYRCSDAPVSLNTWSHVAVNFGGGNFELYVDGKKAVNAHQTYFPFNCQSAQLVSCDDEWTYGIDGNDDAWVLGASNANAGEGAAPPYPALQNVTYPFVDGAIDSFRISNVRREFAY